MSELAVGPAAARHSRQTTQSNAPTTLAGCEDRLQPGPRAKSGRRGLTASMPGPAQWTKLNGQGHTVLYRSSSPQKLVWSHTCWKLKKGCRA
ncbi:hypothetical protein AAFF_G00106450 [Aldrovandia affinis]|uniref:Uncharacterized protein n=1 Tax=Aldrovandia affinis TaxID=143900 RepID=A0AAD7T2C3_9TELE|nr:hypothetical protein AAFF_G00106450 [Aldrovandia affinis]